MPSEVSHGGAHHDREPTVQELKRELAEAREQQAASNEILRVISNSPSAVQPVFDAIHATAVRLLRAHSGLLTRVVRDQIVLASMSNIGAMAEAAVRATFPRSLLSDEPHAWVIRACAPINSADIESDPRVLEAQRTYARAIGYRSAAVVPLLLRGAAIGTIGVTRRQPGGFTDKEIALLQTFADQAVIAIENTRLFEAEQESKRELQNSLAYQTAISEVLGIISRSPAQLQPVFNAIVVSCKRLLRAHSALVLRVVGHQLSLAAFTPVSPESDKELQERYPRALDGMAVYVAAARDRRPTMICDTETDGRFVDLARRRGIRSLLAVPMLSKGEVIGTISVSRSNPGPFADTEIELLKNFADQAVIAIENTRLFEAEQQSKRELQESLEYQIATAEVLGVISRSPTDAQPVFVAIASSAAKLCNAQDAVVFRVDGDMLRLVAHHGSMPIAEDVPLRYGTVGGRAVIERRLIHIEDVQADEVEYPEGSEFAKRFGTRTNAQGQRPPCSPPANALRFMSGMPQISGMLEGRTRTLS